MRYFMALIEFATNWNVTYKMYDIKLCIFGGGRFSFINQCSCAAVSRTVFW